MHSARMLRSIGKNNTDCAILSWNVSWNVSIHVYIVLSQGAVILGVSEAGNANEMRIRFADATVDDWPVTDFITR